jgi:hypothetical protein
MMMLRRMSPRLARKSRTGIALGKSAVRGEAAVRQTQSSRTLTNSLRILLGIVPYRDNLGHSRPFGP